MDELFEPVAPPPPPRMRRPMRRAEVRQLDHGITVYTPEHVEGPHQWTWGDEPPHRSLNCSCGWSLYQDREGGFDGHADRVWQAHRAGRDDT